MIIGYGVIALFFGVVVIVLERMRRSDGGLSEYAVAGRAFGPGYQTMSFLNTWLPGAVFTTFTGLAVSEGVIGFYWVPYSLLTIVLMFFMAERVHHWGRTWELISQADLLGMRYASHTVQTVGALVGIISSFPWIVLGMQSLGLVFSHLSFGRVSDSTAVLIGVGVLAIRQVWTVRLGMRGIVVSDMVQSIVAYFLGLCLIIGMLMWLGTHGHGLSQVSATHFTLPGPGSALGPLYLMSLVLTGALGGWCWPDIFVRLFTARSAATIKKSAVQAAPFLMVFATALALLGLLASSMPEVAAKPSAMWFIVAGAGGTLLIALAGVAVLAATMGNVDANLQAIGIQLSHDVRLRRRERMASGETASAKLAVVALTVLAALVASGSLHSGPSLNELAILSYQGVVQLAPTLLLGIFWRRGNAVGAVTGMVSGILIAGVLQVQYPLSVPWLGGLTSGVAALIVNTVIYVAAAYLVPRSTAERARVDALFEGIDDHQRTPSPAPVPADYPSDWTTSRQW
ncbi:sodium:solute symporter family protein [Streptomyces sp. NBC_00322]|uniref:sodium:solute symporter family protein n=1 Tax=Streptomyces sp. NBC_00322 TaxID=2975712 RepID=UPI002E2A6E72|nr:sodium:solute symporter family protein [Streptomyces sp. NBC_00322]